MKRAITVLAFSIVLAGCGSDNVPDANTFDDVEVIPKANVSFAAGEFNPPRVSVPAGEFIELVNDDDGEIRVSSSDPIYSIGQIPPGGSTTLGFRGATTITFTVDDRGEPQPTLTVVVEPVSEND